MMCGVRCCVCAYSEGSVLPACILTRADASKNRFDTDSPSGCGFGSADFCLGACSTTISAVGRAA